MIPLTIWRLEEDIQDHDRIVENRNRLAVVPISVDGGVLGLLYVQSRLPKPPRWVDYFNEVEELADLRLANQSTAAVFVVNRPANTFVLTFGLGHLLLRDGIVDERFGLRVTLNAIEPASIRSIDHKRLEVIARHTREQVSRKSGLEQFGLDVERDLLSAVTGTPTDEALGRMLSGGRQLVVTGNLPLNRLGERLDELARLGRSYRYRDSFPWVDNLAEVSDPARKRDLDDLLVERMRDEDTSRIWLAIPEVINWADVGGFSYTSGRRGPEHDEVSLEDYFADRVLARDTTLASLKNDHVQLLSAATGQMLNTWSVYRCLVAEIESNGKVYVLSEGRWYRVEPSFLASIDAIVADLRPSAVALLPYQDASEGEYNARVARQSNGTLTLLDQNLVRYGSRAPIEVCDLYSRDRVLVHVKHSGASSVLSHLFSQGVVSAQLIVGEPLFRELVCEKLPPVQRWPDPAGPFDATGFEVAYAVITKRRPLRLPFFSRVNLRNAVKTLRALGFRVTLSEIPA